MAEYIEQSCNIRDVRIAYKLWRADKPKKILALHGWLDNAASFDYLAEILTDYCVVAVDFAGQGLSDARPASASYHLWDDVLDMRLLLQQLDWQHFVLMGHSRGAMVATMLAASGLAEQVERLVLLDAVMPIPVANEQAPEQLTRYLQNHLQLKPTHYFNHREDAIKLRAKASNFSITQAEVLATRQLRHNQKGWYWAIDERLKAASAVKLNQAQNIAFLQALTCPVDIFIASEGMGRLPIMQETQQQFPNFHWHTISAAHHFHMTEAAWEIKQQCFV